MYTDVVYYRQLGAVLRKGDRDNDQERIQNRSAKSKTDLRLCQDHGSKTAGCSTEQGQGAEFGTASARRCQSRGDVGVRRSNVPVGGVNMPKVPAATQKGRLTQWLRTHPGRYRTATLAQQHRVSRRVVYATLDELRANRWAKKMLGGRNTYWIVRHPDNWR